MKPTVYIETSVVSYYTSRPSRDLVVSGRQQITREWWEENRQDFELYASVLVLEEARAGDPTYAQRRLEALEGMPILEMTVPARELADRLTTRGPIPEKFSEDALHIALATVHGMDYILTWNFRHINNAKIKSDIARILTDSEYECPVICSPEELGEKYP